VEVKGRVRDRGRGGRMSGVGGALKFSRGGRSAGWLVGWLAGLLVWSGLVVLGFGDLCQEKEGK
jgi:hypothetical protein